MYLDLVVESLEVGGDCTAVDACRERACGEDEREEGIGDHFGIVVWRFEFISSDIGGSVR